MKNAKPLDGVLIASDLDGTVTKQDTIFEFFKQFGVMEEAMRLDEKEPSSDVRIILDKLTRKKPISVQEFEKIADQAEFFCGAKEFFSSMQQLGAKIIFLTAAYEPIAKKIAERLGVDAIVCATKVKEENGFVTGFEGPVMDGKMKEQALIDFCEKNNFLLAKTIGLGDSKMDLNFLNKIKKEGGKSFLLKNPDFEKLGKEILEMNWSGMKCELRA